MNCRICESENIQLINLVSFRPQYYKQEWCYILCKECGCLQIAEIPNNLDKYYNSEYESFLKEKSHTFQDWLFMKKMQYAISGKGIIGRTVEFFYQYGDYRFLRGVLKEAAILDVGCGGGHLIKQLYKAGYKNLEGIDPYLEADWNLKNYIHLYKKDIFSFKTKNKYDLVMMNHSFEHMENPFEVLKTIKKIMNPNGILSIEIPIVNDYLLEKYGTYIDSLDPPFHFYLHTKESMEMLLNEGGFELINVTCHLSPMIDDFAKMAKAEKCIKGRNIFQSVAITIKSYNNRTLINKKKLGNIARFVCQLKK